jgi:hypothetical protein
VVPLKTLLLLLKAISSCLAELFCLLTKIFLQLLLLVNRDMLPSVEKLLNGSQSEKH